MYGVALDIRFDDFRRVLRDPLPVIVGLISQFVLLPALTFALILYFDPHPGLALGMLLVACCPGGNISNFVTQLARGNAALSVTLTACSTAAATFLLPMNFALWTGLWLKWRGEFSQSGGAAAPQSLELQLLDMFVTVSLLLALPLILGMLTARRWPNFSAALRRVLRVLSLLFLGGFIAGALYANWDHFVNYIGAIVGIVFVHNSAALLVGYLAARTGGQNRENRRAILFETGIQNSGLALVLIFDFFDGRGGLALIAAWWGVWHIVAGLTLATVFHFLDRD